MPKWINVIRQVLNGTIAIDDRKKYMILCLDAAAFHLIFAVLFGINHMVCLFWYNAVVVAYYIYLAFISVRKGHFMLVFISAFVEVLFHSSFASLMLGWNWGFMLYTIALVPLVFYLTYTLPGIRKSLLFPVMSSAIVTVCYFAVRIACENMPPIYEAQFPPSLPTGFYHINMLVMFLMMLTFSILFSLEIRYMQGKLEHENRTLGEIALYDPLTHLLNRRSMDDYLMQVFSKTVQSGGEFCLIMSDIDDFKKINDTYGHDCGDMVLVKVSEIMSACVRKNDYVCRWGGEEMLILLQSGPETAEKVADRICKEVRSSEIDFENRKVHVTITLGVSAYSENATIHSMISEADHKLYHGKKNGKNRVVV